MTVTYNEMRERFNQLEQAKEDRRNLVISEAVKLVDAYKNSLGLDSPIWTDIQGNSQPYVMVGVFYGDNFRTTSLNSIELNANYALWFSIATVIDDSPRGGEYKTVSVGVYIENDAVAVSIDNKKIVIIDNDWTAVCNYIKDRVLMSISDRGLYGEACF